MHSLIEPTTEPIDAKVVSDFCSIVSRSSSVVIGTHLNPDGDALGSALAVSHYLDGLGIENEVLCHHAPPRNLRFLPGVSRIRRAPRLEKHDLGIVVDLDAVDRLGDVSPAFQACDKIIVVDHHVPHEAPGDLRIVDPEACATAAILTKLFLQLAATFTPATATCLLTGIVTDTGSFRFRNTNAEAMGLASFLLASGADINIISEEVFQNKTEGGMRLLGLVLDNMKLVDEGRIVYSTILLDDFDRIGAKDEDTEGFVNELLGIETAQIAVLARETKPKRIRVSLRSRRTIDVAEVARQFGGGGHKNAAGCTLEGDIIPALGELVRSLKRCLASS